MTPRRLAWFCLVTALLQMYSIGRPFFGHEVQFMLLMPTGLALLALSVWLLWKGFAEPA